MSYKSKIPYPEFPRYAWRLAVRAATRFYRKQGVPTHRMHIYVPSFVDSFLYLRNHRWPSPDETTEALALEWRTGAMLESVWASQRS